MGPKDLIHTFNAGRLAFVSFWPASSGSRSLARAHANELTCVLVVWMRAPCSQAWRVFWRP